LLAYQKKDIKYYNISKYVYTAFIRAILLLKEAIADLLMMYLFTDFINKLSTEN